MSWAISEFNGRDIGYGVPAICDFPKCGEQIDRGLSYVCGGEPYGGERGCGLFFCGKHLAFGPRQGDPLMCSRCRRNKPPFTPTPDTLEWINHKLTDESWAQWRDENTAEAQKLIDSQTDL